MQSNGQSGFYNIISVAMLVLTMLAGCLALAIFVNPDSAFNPFPPEKAESRPSPTVFVPPTLTPTFPVPTLPPTWTPSVTPTRLPTSTPTNTPTVTPTSTATTTVAPTFTNTFTPTATQPTKTPTLTPTSTTSSSSFAYILQSGTPNYDAHPSGCNWVGAGGIVFDKNGNGDNGVTVRIRGVTDTNFNKTTISGTAGYYSAVGGGWEIKFGNTPTVATYEIRLQNSSGTALSAWTQFATKTACAQNVVLVNFTKK